MIAASHLRDLGAGQALAAPPARSADFAAPCLRERYQTLASDGGTVASGLQAVLTETLERPGSLFRARLAHGILDAHGVARNAACKIAIAIEYFHTASLLLDDLPAMDNAATRRGAPCSHQVHGEAHAILASLALVNRGYALFWQVFATLTPVRAAQASNLVECCLGTAGILSGQSRDLRFGAKETSSEPSETESRASQAARIQAIADGKTGSLLRLSLVLPAIVAGSSRRHQRALEHVAELWGRVYQALDDFGDVLARDQESGKTGRRDVQLGRPNLVAALGLDAALERVATQLAKADRHLESLTDEPHRWRTVFQTQGLLSERHAAVVNRLRGHRRSRAPRRQRTVDPLVFLADHLVCGAGQGRTAVVTIPAPAVDATHLLEILSEPDVVFWENEQHAMAGVGVAHRLQAWGADRYATVRAEARRLGSQLSIVAYPGLSPHPTKWFGGFAFQPGAAEHPTWGDFGDAAFVLPEILYQRDDGGACLTIALPDRTRSRSALRNACVARVERLLDALADHTVSPLDDAPKPRSFVHVSWPDPAVWHGNVLDIQQDIAAGGVEKVVASGVTQVRLVRPPHLPSLLRRLRQQQPGTFRFAFGRGPRTFVGATPERLIALDVARVRTVALAGTAPLGTSGAELLDSAKDQLEHRLVVESIEERLRPWCTDLTVPTTPRVRRIAAVRHLETPIAGTLAVPRHVLELVARLHPTPAVGGTPTAAALAWINAHESRGWYAAPVGWFDLDGNGEIAVALRSALIEDRQVRLFAGAGIVAASDPGAEYAETKLKTNALLDSLRTTRSAPPSLSTSDLASGVS